MGKILKRKILAFFLAIQMIFMAVPVNSIVIAEENNDAPITNPFTSDVQFTVEGEKVDSNSYRIPAMVTLADGTIVAAADIRWNTTYDGGCLDTIVARSTDNGLTWQYGVANYLGDNGNAYNPQSTAFIDPCLTVAADGKTVYMLCDLYPYGIALNGNGGQSLPSTDIGFTSEGYLRLSGNEHSSYDYYLKDGYIYDSSSTQVRGYTVDEYFNLYDETGTKVSNLFFADSPYKVVRTGFLYLISSFDGGENWSEPTLLDLKTSSENVCLASPGSGITTSNGIMVFPVYSYTAQTQKLGFIYSSDNGATWYRSTNFDVIWASESAVVEIGEGVLRFFFRNKTEALCYVDYNMNTHAWSNYVNTGVKTNSNTQLSAITYSKTFNGCQVVLVSCPTGPNKAGSGNSDGSYRTNGKIFVGVVVADGSMTWPKSIDVSPVTATGQLAGFPYSEEQGFFAYSCLTERSDGSIAIMYENCQSGWGDSNYFNINMRSYTTVELGVSFDSEGHSTILSNDNISVSGVIPTGVSLQIADVAKEKVDAVKNTIIDTTPYAEVVYVSGQNIALTVENSEKLWQPGTTRPVTVTISEICSAYGKEMPSVEVYHILDDLNAVSRAKADGYLLTCSDPDLISLYPDAAALRGGTEVPYVRLSSRYDEVAIHQNGSLSFKTDSFSDYFIVLGFTDGLSLSNNGNDTYYVEPDTVLTFNRKVTWTPQGTEPDGVIASDDKITISKSVTIPSEVEYKATWSGNGNWWGSSGGTATITIKIATRNQIISGALNDDKYPVILSVVQGVSTIPSEPGHTNGSYYQLNDSYAANQSYPPSYLFSETAKGVINPEISDVLTKSIDGSNTIGYADASGVTILRNLTAIDWDKILERAVSNSWKAIDGTTITKSNKNLYKIVPYVVKLMDGSNWSGKGWHIDCAIVLKNHVTLSYDMNLDNYQVSGTLKLPNTASGIPAPTFSTAVGSITYGTSNLSVGSSISATYNEEQMALTFKGWNTSPDGTGIMYTPGAEIAIDEDTVLYAIWEGELVPGELYIYKVVTTEDGATEPVNAKYLFNINFGTAGVYNYAIYEADGATVSTGTVDTAASISLSNGEYAVFANIPANTTYTITEEEGAYKTTSEGSSGSIRSGGRAVARFVNHYQKIEPTNTVLTIKKEGYSGYESIDPHQTFIFDVKGIDGTATEKIDLTVTIHGNGKIIITDLPIGDYVITEKAEWSWRYRLDKWSFTTDSGSDTIGTDDAHISLGVTGNEILFTNERSDTYWLDGDSYNVNIFNGTAN